MNGQSVPQRLTSMREGSNPCLSIDMSDVSNTPSTQTTYILPICPEALSGWIYTKFGIGVPSRTNQLCRIFVDWFRGIDFIQGWNLPIPIGIEGRRYNTVWTAVQTVMYEYARECCNKEQEVKVIWQKAPHGGPIPRLGVTPGGRKLYYWIPGVGFPISVP